MVIAILSYVIPTLHVYVYLITSTDNENSNEGEEVPDVLYQIKVKQRSDKINTAGKWIKKEWIG